MSTRHTFQTYIFAAAAVGCWRDCEIRAKKKIRERAEQNARHRRRRRCDGVVDIRRGCRRIGGQWRPEEAAPLGILEKQRHDARKQANTC